MTGDAPPSVGGSAGHLGPQGTVHDAKGWMPPFYLINLDRSPERLAQQRQQFARLGLDFIRIAALDGRTISRAMITKSVRPRLNWIGPVEQWMYDGEPPAIYSLELHRYLSVGEIGCSLSHARALTAFIDSGSASAIILEDDAEIDATLIENSDLLEPWLGRPVIIKLQGVMGGDTRFSLTRARRGNILLCAPVKPSAGSVGYFVTREAAQKMLASLTPMREPYDQFLRKYWGHGVSVVEWRPFPMRQFPGFDSLIAGRERSSVKLSLAQRLLLGPLRFWIKVEHVLSRLWFAARWGLALSKIGPFETAFCAGIACKSALYNA